MGRCGVCLGGDTVTTWTLDQQRALTQIEQHLLRGDPATPYILKGAAGTGKTTLLKAALADRQGVLAVAQTHKACAVLTRTLRDVPGVTVKTISSALGYGREVDDETGARTFARIHPDTLDGVRTVIVDEGSMVPAELWAELQADLAHRRIRAVVMGDPLQLPPVGEECSAALDGYGYELREVKRNAGVLCAAIQDIRAQMGGGAPPWLWSSQHDAQGQVVGHRDQRAMHATWLDLVRSGADVVCVAWTNRAVEIANRVARRAVVGDDAAPYAPGEWLVLLEPYSTPRGERLHTEDRVRVMHASEATRDGFACWRLTVHTPDGERTVYAPDATQARAIDAAHRDAMSAARRAPPRERGPLWRAAYAIRESFAWVRPHYATTIHKSQGSTWDHVFVMRDVWDCADKPMRDRLIYTATSRPAKSLHLGVWA